MVVVAETLVDARLVGASPMRRCGISSIRTSSIQVPSASIPFSECRCGGRVEVVYNTLSPCRVWPTCGSVIDMVASMKSEPVAVFSSTWEFDQMDIAPDICIRGWGGAFVPLHDATVRSR